MGLLQQSEMPWLFKDTNTTHIHPQKETEVLLLHHLNAKSPKLKHIYKLQYVSKSLVSAMQRLV